MGQCKVPLSLRIREELQKELTKFAKREMRTLGNLGEVLIEWSFEQLKIAGSTVRLLSSTIRVPDERAVKPGKGDEASER